MQKALYWWWGWGKREWWCVKLNAQLVTHTLPPNFSQETVKHGRLGMPWLGASLMAAVAGTTTLINRAVHKCICSAE